MPAAIQRSAVSRGADQDGISNGMSSAATKTAPKAAGGGSGRTTATANPDTVS
jgi:hypothetical protein